jgi:hypothetical protein
MSASDLVIGNVIDDGDYIHITCTNCDLACEVDYLSLDALAPQLKIVCPNCGELGEWKLANAGRGFFEIYDKYALLAHHERVREIYPRRV